MKLSKTSWLLLAIGVFITTFASLGTVCSQQVHQQNQLNEELTLAELKLNGFQREASETQLSQTLSQLETAKATLSQPIGSVATTSILLDVAEAYSAEVTEISSSDLASADLEGIPCSALTLTARVVGDVPNLVSFITKLNDDLGAGAVKSVVISIPEVTSEEKASASIQLVVYTYQGD